jgi:hypothetical protein
MNEARQRPGRSARPQVIFGLAIVLLGLAFLANNLGFGQFRVAFRFWPMAFTVLGIALLLERGTSSSRKFWGAAFVIGGLWQTAVEAFGLKIYIDDYWPLVLIGLGVLLVVRSISSKTPAVEDYTNVGTPVGAGSFPSGSVSGSVTGPAASTSGAGSPYAAGPQSSFAGGDETVNAFAFMGGVRRNIVSPVFKRGTLTAIMGGVVLDLRQSQAAGGETVVEMFAMMGGIEVRVPPDWQVINEITPIMGGVEDRSLHTQPIRHRLVLKGVVFMAGVEVKS